MVEAIEAAYPSEPGVGYIEYESPGRKKVRPWQLGFWTECGYKGMLICEDINKRIQSHMKQNNVHGPPEWFT